MSGVAEAITAAGLRPATLFAEAGIDAEGADDPEGWIARDGVVALFDLIAERSGDPFFGLRLGATVEPLNMGFLAYLVTNAPTLQQALNDVQSYGPLFCEAADMRVSTADGPASLVCQMPPASGQKGRQFAEWHTAMIVAVLRRMVGARWSPLRVSFQHERPGDLTDYASHLGAAEVVFRRPATAILIAAADLNHRTRQADARLYAILKSQARAMLGGSAANNDLTRSLRLFVARTLPRSYPAIEDAAREAGVSVRTLQRRLNGLGTDYSRLVDDVRRDLAQQYLGDDTRSLKEIAHLLGYSQPSAFNRAWRRWTGSTPQEYRNRGAAD